MLKRILSIITVLVFTTGYANAICSSNSGVCNPFKGATQPAEKSDDSLWINQPEPEIDPGVKRAEKLFDDAKTTGEAALLSDMSRKFDKQNVNGFAETWCLKSQMTLSDNMKAWVNRAHWSMKWNSEYDYPIESEFCVSGSFQQAINTIASGYLNAQRVLRLDVYPNQSVIVFSDK